MAIKMIRKARALPAKGGGRPAAARSSAVVRHAPAAARAKPPRQPRCRTCDANEIPEGYVPRLKTKYNEEVVPALTQGIQLLQQHAGSWS